MPQAPPSAAVAGRLTGTLSAAAIIRWPVSPAFEEPAVAADLLDDHALLLAEDVQALRIAHSDA